MILSGKSLEVEIHWNDRVICKKKIDDVEKIAPRS
jgi:hypothetical protein